MISARFLIYTLSIIIAVDLVICVSLVINGNMSCCIFVSKNVGYYHVHSFQADISFGHCLLIFLFHFPSLHNSTSIYSILRSF